MASLIPRKASMVWLKLVITKNLLGFSRIKCYPPPAPLLRSWEYGFFWSWSPLDFQSNLPWPHLDFSIFCIETPGNLVFSSIFGVIPEIPTTSTLAPSPLGIMHWYPQQGSGFFFLENPIAGVSKRRQHLHWQLQFIKNEEATTMKHSKGPVTHKIFKKIS